MEKETENRGSCFGLTPSNITTLMGFFGTLTKLCRFSLQSLITVIFSIHFMKNDNFVCSLRIKSKKLNDGMMTDRFYVDNVPIRVYKNEKGVNYPSKPMKVEASLWNGDSWATDGGRTKINYAFSPFIAHFQDFSGLSGCYVDGLSDNVATCGSSNYWWNGGKYQRLRGYEQKIYEHFRNKYMNYDYCTDRSKYQSPECY